MIRRLCVLVLFAIVVSSNTAAAAHLTWEFTGAVTSADASPISGLFPVGTPVSFLVSIDTNATDSCSDPASGFYSMPGSTLTASGQTYASDSTALEVHNPAGNCVGSTPDSTLRLVSFEGAPFYAASIGWPDPQAGDSIPAMPSSAYFFISSAYVMSPDVFGRIDTVRLVPEPHALLTLALAGIAGIGRVTRRQLKPR